MKRKCSLDKFYTKPEVAEMCIVHMMLTLETLAKDADYLTFLEPSVGSGNMKEAYFNKVASLGKNVRHFCNDIDEEVNSTFTQDYLTFTKEQINKHSDSLLVVYGNPPFGKFGNTALKFIEKSVELGADYIFFILPNTFKRTSYINKLPKNLMSIGTLDIGYNSFLLNGETYNVNSTFFMYKRVDFERKEIIPKEIFKRGCKENYDFAIIRAGGRTGRILNNPESRSQEVVLYLKGDINLYKRNEDNLYCYADRISTGAKSLSVLDINYFVDALGDK